MPSPSPVHKNKLSASDVWPSTIVNFTRVKTGSHIHEDKTITLGKISEKELKTIKEHDSFLYYSIPVVRNAEILGKEITSSSLASCNSSKLPSLQVKTKPCTVSRSRRISFECHTSMLLKELWNEDPLEHDADAEM